MSKVKIIQSEKSITINDLIVFQQINNITIPENLKQLLLKYNGGITINSDIFSQLLSIKYGELTMGEIVEYNQVLEKNIPDNYLPFAITGVGHFLTIKLANNNSGKIYVFRHDEFNPILIAESLEEILGVINISEL